jgi:hypothetical protein
MSIDCSLAAQNERRKQLAALRAKLFGGVQSISDRSRSVGYHGPDALMAGIRQLERELDYCDGVARTSRLSYVPLTKGL